MVPDCLLPDLAEVGVTLLPLELVARMRGWDALDDPQRAAVQADVRLMAGLVTVVAAGRG